MLAALFISPRKLIRKKRRFWWAGFVFAIVLTAAIVWWLLRPSEKETTSLTKIKLPPLTSKPIPEKPDDLTRIEGIGPKISALLQSAGIITFSKLAKAEVSHLKKIVREAGIYMANPSTWPEQADLAAAGEWEEFDTLKATLKRGRRA